MATTTYEEEKQPLQRPADLVLPTYAPPAPTATYEGSDQAAIMQQMIADYVNRTDPQAQAEQDAKIQRGRQFWTGANLFANVVANAINANGTAKGAPNMTWNDNASQKMYDTWRDQDKELKADRKAAQQRIDALRLQDAQFRMADAQARDKAALEAYKTNFGLQNEAAKINSANERRDFEYERKKADDDQRIKEQNAFQEKLARIRAAGSGTSSTKTPTDHSVSVGSIDIPAKDKKEAEKIQKDIANKIVERLNTQIAEHNAQIDEQLKSERNPLKRDELEKQKMKPMEKPKNPKEAEYINYQYGDMYDNDTYFRRAINEAYGIEDIYDEEVVPEYEQFGGHSVRPDESSLPEPRRYAGTTPNQTPRAYRGEPVIWNTAGQRSQGMNKPQQQGGSPFDFSKL